MCKETLNFSLSVILKILPSFNHWGCSAFWKKMINPFICTWWINITRSQTEELGTIHFQEVISSLWVNKLSGLKTAVCPLHTVTNNLWSSVRRHPRPEPQTITSHNSDFVRLCMGIHVEMGQCMCIYICVYVNCPTSSYIFRLCALQNTQNITEHLIPCMTTI